MKNIVLDSINQIFTVIMSLYNICRLRVISHSDTFVMYQDYFDNNKVISLDKNNDCVYYTVFGTDVHICFSWNNVTELMKYYYNENKKNEKDIDFYSNYLIPELNEVIEQLEKDKSDLYDKIENIRNEDIEEIDYLNERIEDLKNCNYRMCNELGDYEMKYQDIVKDCENLKQKITEKDTLINSLYNQISNVQYDKNCKIKELKDRIDDLLTQNYDLFDTNESLREEIRFNNEVIEKQFSEIDTKNQTIEILNKKMYDIATDKENIVNVAKKQLDNKNKEISQLYIDNQYYQQQLEDMKRQNNYLHKRIRQMKKA